MFMVRQENEQARQEEERRLQEEREQLAELDRRELMDQVSSRNLHVLEIFTRHIRISLSLLMNLFMALLPNLGSDSALSSNHTAFYSAHKHSYKLFCS